MKHLYKGQRIAVHVLDEHVLPLMPQPIPLGGTIDQWEAYYRECLEIVGPGYSDEDIFDSGYFCTKVEEVVGDQVLFRDSKGELRLVPGCQVITYEEAPKAFDTWLSFKGEREERNSG